MALLKQSEPWTMTADQAARRQGWAARSELALRNAMEDLLRQRRPGARMCHEMVMGEGKVRADLVAVDTDHIIAVEVKGEYDNTTRLLHQVGMYQLCVPEVWMVVPDRHADDAKLIRHLLPSVGLIVGTGLSHSYNDKKEPVTLKIEAEALPRLVVTDCMLEMLWRDELYGVCQRTGTSVATKATRPQMLKALRDLSHDLLQRETCTALRGRNALWRADPRIPTPQERGK